MDSAGWNRIREECGGGIEAAETDGEQTIALLNRVASNWRAGDAQVHAAEQERGFVKAGFAGVQDGDRHLKLFGQALDLPEYTETIGIQVEQKCGALCRIQAREDRNCAGFETLLVAPDCRKFKRLIRRFDFYICNIGGKLEIYRELAAPSREDQAVDFDNGIFGRKLGLGSGHFRERAIEIASSAIRKRVMHHLVAFQGSQRERSAD